MAELFAVIDVETTGGSPKFDRVTEIAIVLHDSKQVIDTWTTLINPERSIPHFITQMTGISDDMVRYAPKFYEIAEEVIHKTEGTILVAHNCRFDYAFLREEFNQLGFSYYRPTLCTVQLSKRAFPNLLSYSLINLCNHLNIQIKNHHRALDDALAAATILERALQTENHNTYKGLSFNTGKLKLLKLPQQIKPNLIYEIPQTPGVYYLHAEDGQVLYVGKSIQLQKRIWEHFTDMSERGLKLQYAIFDISWTETGNEIAALLLENREIKKHKPLFNKALRCTHFPYVILYNPMENYFYMQKSEEILAESHTVIKAFTKKQYAIQHLNQLNLEYKIQPPAHLADQNSMDLSLVNNNQENLILALKELQSWQGRKVLVDKGIDQNQLFILLINNGRIEYRGYIDQNDFVPQFDVLKKMLSEEPFCPVADAILRRYVKNHPNIRNNLIDCK